MGDMKTPDFDDLLAAFDIPDIDAKEAIQSSPEVEHNEVGSAADEGMSASSSCFPCPLVSHNDPPVVSVIVKNTVRTECFEEEKCVSDKMDNSSNSGLNSYVQVRFDDLTSQHVPKVTTQMEHQIANSNGFDGLVTSHQGQSSTQPWPQHVSTSMTPAPNTNEGGIDKGGEDGLVQHTTQVISSLKPLPYLQSSAGVVGPDIPVSLSSQSISPHFSPPHPQKEETSLCNPAPSLPLNGNMKDGTKHGMDSDDDDSEPDLGSPLVIQESPESAMSSPPKFKHRAKFQYTETLGSPESTSCLVSQPLNFSLLVSAKPEGQCEEKEQDTTCSSSPTTLQSRGPQDCLHSVSTHTAADKKEKYPEHVIEERDSPESPPPSETGFVVPKKSSSPESSQISDLSANHKDVCHKDELMESELRQEDRSPDNKHLTENIVVKDENYTPGTEEPESDSLVDTVSPPLHPLKVKIKMHSSSVTKTVNGGAAKRSGRFTAKGVDSSKASPEYNAKSKTELVQEPQEGPIKLKGTNTEPVDTRPRVKATAVNITRTAALPAISASLSRVSPGGVNFDSLKSLNSGSSQLTHLQNSGRPASIVNSTGAIISKSQTSLVEAFNKILNNRNLLPSYKPDLSSPPPAEWGIPLPAQGYRCLECGDAFALEQSLVRHYSRRSLRIEVTCNQCAKRLAFFNKCSLLLHAREHKEKGLIMQCSHLVMKPVPVEQMIGQPESVAVGGLSPSLLSSSSGQASSVSGQATSNPKPQPNKKISSKKADTVQRISSKCLECQTQFSSKEEVAHHFQEVKPAQTASCTECSPPMLLSNSCSAAAHQRIHQSCKPHICPECGSSVERPLFQTHLDRTCLHFSRRIGYRCCSCQVVFGGLNSVKSHIQKAHCDIFHKCPSCPMAFKSAPSIQNHITSQHPALTDAQTVLIFKCVMCDTVFTNKVLLHVHFDTHLTNQKVHVFKCPECTKLFSQRNSLLEHFKIHKPPQVKEELPSLPAISSHSHASLMLESSDGEPWMDEDEAETVRKEKTKTPSGWKCVLCHECYKDRDVYVSHMAEKHGKTLKKFPCNKCENSFTTTSSLRRHIRDKHKVANRGFCCQFCSDGKKTFSSRAMLEKHIKLRHSKDAEGQDILMGGVDEADSSSEQDTRMRARHRRRGAVKMEQDEESTDGQSPVKKSQSSSALATYSQPESGFRCAPCGFTTEDQALFLDHIAQHRRGGTEGSQQCLQCGACFTSTSSLARHCFIAHKVKNAVADSNHSLNMHPEPSPLPGRNHDRTSQDSSAPGSPSSVGIEDNLTLTCKVCRKRFEKTSDLNTHFRTHGMAFISARNAGKTA